MDGRGRPLCYLLTPGQAADCRHVQALLEGVSFAWLIGDRAYDTDALRAWCAEHAVEVVIPSKRNRKVPIPHDQARSKSTEHGSKHCIVTTESSPRISVGSSLRACLALVTRRNSFPTDALFLPWSSVPPHVGVWFRYRAIIPWSLVPLTNIKKQLSPNSSAETNSTIDGPHFTVPNYGMAEVHQTIIQYGIEAARSQAATKHERMLVDAAYRVLAEDAEKIGFTYSGFALTSLPHKPQKETVWRRESHNIVLIVEVGA